MNSGRRKGILAASILLGLISVLVIGFCHNTQGKIKWLSMYKEQIDVDKTPVCTLRINAVDISDYTIENYDVVNVHVDKRYLNKQVKKVELDCTVYNSDFGNVCGVTLCFDDNSGIAGKIDSARECSLNLKKNQTKDNIYYFYVPAKNDDEVIELLETKKVYAANTMTYNDEILHERLSVEYPITAADE